PPRARAARSSASPQARARRPNFRDEPLRILAADEYLKRASESEVGREAVVDDGVDDYTADVAASRRARSAIPTITTHSAKTKYPRNAMPSVRRAAIGKPAQPSQRGSTR